MPLLSLPSELAYLILTFLDWDDILSFISTTSYINIYILAKSDIARLRRNCAARLLSWETAQREQRNWALEPNPIKGAWYQHVQHYRGRNYRGHNYHMDLFCALPDGSLSSIPCYTCLRFKKLSTFSSSMRCGALMVGQKGASRRICIPCGVRTGFYYAGEKFGARYSICVQCGHLMSPWNGARNNPESLEEVEGSVPERMNVFTRPTSEPDANSVMLTITDRFDNFWWWRYSHMCAICTDEKGYSVKKFLDAEPKKDVMEARMKEKYKKSMIASLERRREKGRKSRAELGIPESEHRKKDLDIEALKLKDDPFVNFRPVPLHNFDTTTLFAGNED